MLVDYMELVFTPDWFKSFDVLIGGFSFLVLVAFFILAYRTYKLRNNKNSLYLGIGFLLIALAEIATILTKAVIFYDTSFTQQIGNAIIVYHVLRSVDTLYYAGFFFHKLLTLLGLYLIYRIPLKRKAGTDAILIVMFLIISAVFGTLFYFVFHIVAIVLLSMIVHNYYKVHVKNSLVNTLVLLIAFSILLASHVILMLSNLTLFYVLGQGLELASYVIMLYLMIRILKPDKKNGRKEKQIRYCL